MTQVYRLCLCLLTTCVVSAQITLQTVRPNYGPPGTETVLIGAGFSAGAAYTVAVGGVAAPVRGVTATEVRFQVPATSAGGEIVLNAGGERHVSPMPFLVTRRISGRLVLPSGVPRSEYVVSAMETFVTPDLRTAQFQLDIPATGPSIVFASAAGNRPAFMAVAGALDTEVTINARSTAVALAFLNPAIATRNTARAEALLISLNNLPETQALADRISELSSAGIDYLDHPDYEALMVALLQKQAGAARQARSLVQAMATPGPDEIKVLSEDRTGTIPFTRQRLKAQFTNVNELLDTVNVKIDSALDTNPLDWYVQIFEVNKDSLPNGRLDFRALRPTDILQTVGDPIKSFPIHAELSGSKIDLVERLAKVVTDFIFAMPDDYLQPNEARFDRQRGGVYVAHAYSGNLYYGTPLFPGNQSALIGQLEGRFEWSYTLAANIVITAIDTVSIFVPADAVVDDPKFIHEMIHTVAIDVMKAVAAHEPGGLDADAVYDVIKATTQALFKALIGGGVKKAGEAAGEEAAETFLQRMATKVGKLAKIVEKGLDILGKLSAAEQAFERGASLLTPNAMAVERFAWIIGNPFEPLITDFYPKEGFGGDVITLQGLHFPSDRAKVRVTFVEYLTTEQPPRPSAEVEAEVLAASPRSLAVRVPTNWMSSFPLGTAYIAVQEVGRDITTSTRGLAPGNQRFSFIRPPSLFRALPQPARAGGRLVLEGTNFGLNAAELHSISIDGFGETRAEIAGTNYLMVTLPPALDNGPHSITLKYRDLPAVNTINFTVANPPPTGQNGLRITVTRLDQSNAPDGQISLFEALMIANGTLGRPIEQHDPREFLPQEDPARIPFRVRETDHVSGDEEGNGGGPNSPDEVVLAQSLVGQTMALTAALPPPSDNDSYNLNMVFDGSGAPAGASAWTFDGVTGAELWSATFRGFKSHGVHFKNGATGNYVYYARVENCGGSGMFFDESAEDNYTIGVNVSGAALHGLHLSGAGVRFNAVVLQGTGTTNILGLYENCGGNGILIEGGARFNKVHPGTVRNNGAAGILVRGDETSFNLLGRPDGSLPRWSDIYNNNGPGVHLLNVNNNVLRFLNPAGNRGDGVLLEGPDCDWNQVDSIHSGIKYYGGGPTTVMPNEGSGLRLTGGASHNLIGSRIPGSAGGRSSYSGNRDDGVLIEGPATSHNTVNRAHFAAVAPGAAYGFMPNGKNGIHIRGGAHHNILGDHHEFLDIHVMASKDAGILIEGAGSDHNRVIGAQIGTDHQNAQIGPAGRNRIGVHIKDGPKANVIGAVGDPIEVIDGFNFDPYLFGNFIANSSEAGVFLDNAGGQLNAAGGFTDANIIQNNNIGAEQFGRIGPNEVGVKIANGAGANFIGGFEPAQANRIVHNHAAGILITNNVLADPALSSAIMRNIITNNGGNVLLQDDPTAGPPRGVGILVDGNSALNRIGGDIANSNVIFRNQVGVYINNSRGITLHGQTISSNRLNGVVVRASTDTEIGGLSVDRENRLAANGSSLPHHAGLLITRGERNRALRNSISKTMGSGVEVHESPNNVIGYGTLHTGNEIIENDAHGVMIVGAASVGNQVRANLIGRDRTFRRAGNSLDGVHIAEGASRNIIGGEGSIRLAGVWTPTRFLNIINENSGHGVAVAGANSTGNSILNNDISANKLTGIAHLTGGNHLQPPPLQLAYDGFRLSGKVDNIANTPAGSVIQVFSDPDLLQPEGASFLGSAVVLPGGAWSASLILPPAFNVVTMTATHPDGSTSEFGTAQAVELGFEIARSGTDAATTIPSGAVVAPGLRLSLLAINADVTVRSIALEASGSLNDATHISSLRLFRDLNRDGFISPVDAPISEPLKFTNDNGIVAFALTNITVAANSDERWIVAVNLAAGAPDGSTYTLRVLDAAAVKAQFLQPAGVPALARAIYPVTSAQFTVNTVAGQTYAGWGAAFFTPTELADEQISGQFADPDGDGVGNIYEYAFNMNPKQADREFLSVSGSGLPAPGKVTMIDPADQQTKDFFTISYVRRKAPVDLTYHVEVSADLATWQPLQTAAGGPLVVSQTDIGAGNVLESLTVRTPAPMRGAGAARIQFLRVRLTLP